jgi:signal transduction histidine kinase
VFRPAERLPVEGRPAAASATRARRRRGPGLRVRLTLLATGLVAAVSAVLLWLGWMLVGEVAASLPTLPPQTPVLVDGVSVPAGEIAAALGHSARTEVLQVGSIAFALVVIAAAMVSWVLAGHVLRPVHEVTATARRLSAESLDERIDLEGPRDEVAQLADTFDAMLDRLQAAFDAQRRFVANASHELRTPLAVLRTEIDVTLADPDADVAELRRMAGVLRDATRRAEGLVEALLLLARTESAEHRPAAGEEPVDLDLAARRALDAVRAEVEGRRLHVSITSSASGRSGPDGEASGFGDPATAAGEQAPPIGVLGCLAGGDAALLERVVGNLVENAVRHNVEGGWLAVTTRRVPDRATEHADRAAEHTDRGSPTVELVVASSGPVIDPDRVPDLFEPFRRGTDRVGPGSGLGLSIVRAVVRSHGGSVSAEPVPGGGLSVRVLLPAAPQDQPSGSLNTGATVPT